MGGGGEGRGHISDGAYNRIFTITERILARWSRAMVYESIDHRDDVTCHAVPVVLFLVFRKKKINVIVKKALQNNHSPAAGGST